ncbi:zinc transporter ZntB [Alteraurantiacibacter aestuarii]|uniref:Zinc transporter ZntB n=1 Tax=Alteraurantiacibacter aestuarii TaxID=650004 RepID=A0A844ZJD5_9SPHN|nr:CorA family divalent cation transporter [Alteraurantiacibacter aestuarii]MXO87888.1 zinc transporter ZntB [Alteraurantiacibacter aestuarii]
MIGFVLVRSGDNVVRELAEGKDVAVDGAALLWEHIEQASDADISLKIQRTDIPAVVFAALVASETRPRCDQIEDGALINLRGPAALPAPDGDRLVSIRAWVHGDRVISVSRRGLAATSQVATAMKAGAISDCGDLVAAFSQSISNGLDPQVASLGDDVDDCESELEAGNIYQLRRRIATIRSQAIAFRRFIAPNRDALLTLAGLRVDWLADDDRLHIREAADRFSRMAEELEAIRERAALLHEQLTDLRAELVDQRSLMIAIVAFIFLPLTFITGLLGMNVQGIPFANQPWAFWGVVAFCNVVGLIVLGWFGMRHWLGR